MSASDPHRHEGLRLVAAPRAHRLLAAVQAGASGPVLTGGTVVRTVASDPGR